MSTVSRINGFRPVKTGSGPYTGQANLYFVPASDATVIMVGDAVKLLGDARAATGVPTVTRIAAGTDIPVGVVVGILFTGVGDTANVPPVNDLNTPMYRRASTDRYLLVADDPALIYEVQLAGAGPAAAAVTASVGLNGVFTVTAGSTTSGNSGMQLDSASQATTATLPLKIVGIPNRPDNIPGDAFISYYVKLNSSAMGSLGTTGV